MPHFDLPFEVDDSWIGCVHGDGLSVCVNDDDELVFRDEGIYQRLVDFPLLVPCSLWKYSCAHRWMFLPPLFLLCFGCVALTSVVCIVTFIVFLPLYPCLGGPSWSFRLSPDLAFSGTDPSMCCTTRKPRVEFTVHSDARSGVPTVTIKREVVNTEADEEEEIEYHLVFHGTANGETYKRVLSDEPSAYFIVDLCKAYADWSVAAGKSHRKTVFSGPKSTNDEP